MNRLPMQELRLFFTALQFLTRVPVPRWVGFRPHWLRDSTRYFPLVGALVGGVSAAVFELACWLWPVPVALGCALLAGVVVTGAFHEDGLADTCDALGGAVSRERALEIMKDSRIGSYGAMGLLLVLGLKAAVLAALPVAWVPAALVWGHAASRAAAVTLMRMPYAGDPHRAKAKPVATQVAMSNVIWVWAGIVLLSALACRTQALPLPGLLCAGLGLLLALLLCARCWQRRLGGFTGDTLGATQQLAELAALLGLLASLRLV